MRDVMLILGLIWASITVGACIKIFYTMIKECHDDIVWRSYNKRSDKFEEEKK